MFDTKILDPKDNSGSISASELRGVLLKLDLHLNENEFEDLVASLDTNKDGSVQFDGK
jgi:Ca2+-binding EF-hand superfamily protein